MGFTMVNSSMEGGRGTSMRLGPAAVVVAVVVVAAAPPPSSSSGRAAAAGSTVPMSRLGPGAPRRFKAAPAPPRRAASPANGRARGSRAVLSRERPRGGRCGRLEAPVMAAVPRSPAFPCGRPPRALRRAAPSLTPPGNAGALHVAAAERARRRSETPWLPFAQASAWWRLLR